MASVKCRFSIFEGAAFSANYYISDDIDTGSYVLAESYLLPLQTADPGLHPSLSLPLPYLDALWT